MLFTEEAKQQFTDASLKIYDFARLIGLEPYPGAPTFVRHFDIELEMDNKDAFDTDSPIEYIVSACLLLSGNIFLLLRDKLDDKVMMDYFMENIPTIVDFKHQLEYEQATHFAVTIESSADCKVTIVTLRLLMLPGLSGPSTA